MMNRREVLKAGLLAGGAVLVSFESNQASAASQVPSHPTGGNFDPPSPAVVNPFCVELNRMPEKTSLPGGAGDLSQPANGGVAPNGTVYPQILGNDALTSYRNSLERIVALQQRNSANNLQVPPQRFYVLRVKQNDHHVFHPQPPYDKGSVVWGYDGMFPGPTFKSHHGVPILVRIFNDLYFDDKVNPPAPGRIFGGFGDPRISTHLHNGHTGSESDGNPADVYPPFFDPAEALHVPKYPTSIKELRFRDHHYPMFRAGLDPSRDAGEPAPNMNEGDIAESISTLWYHDHSIHFTAQNTYKGLVGVHLVFDEVDSGDEQDTNPKALRLPSGEFDIPLLFQDKRFAKDENGAAQLFLPLVTANNLPVTFGVLGDVFTVNGQINPKVSVKRRKYRFRLVNAGPSRFYQFFLTKRNDDQTPPVDQPFIRIGNDESLLEKPYNIPVKEGLLLAVAERADVIIDFTNYAPGDKLYLVNRLVMFDTGEAPVGDIDFSQDPPKFLGYKTLTVNGNQDQGDYIMRFEVSADPVNDPSKVPPVLRKNPVLPRDLFDPMTNQLKSKDKLKALPNHRSFEFAQLGSAGQEWVINGRPFHTSPAGAAKLGVGRLDVPRNSLLAGADAPDGEVWTIVNTGAWAHPVHIHLEEFQILLRNGSPPKEWERCKKDVLRLDPLDEVQIFLRFRDFLGKYPIHCHNVLHEDHEMMLRFDVVGDS